MGSIKKNLDTEASRRFWESFPKREDNDENIVLPSLGEAWWEAEKELSPSFLSKKDSDLDSAK